MSEKKRSRDGGKWFREMKSELKKVVWPTLPQVVKSTAIVIAMSLIVAAFIGIFDYGLNAGVTAILPDKAETITIEQPVETTPVEQAEEAPVEAPAAETTAE